MRCSWSELMAILPSRLRDQLDPEFRETLQELRLRVGMQPELVSSKGSKWLPGSVSSDDLNHCINCASRYSPWNTGTMEQGYLTAPGGHRIGFCGETVIKEGRMAGFRRVTSLCIRVARDFPGIAEDAANLSGSILILGPPGWGKTTLLRDLIRQFSDRGEHIAVVDERCELFPPEGGFRGGRCTDVLSGCPKGDGISIVLRTMGPSVIAVDEITVRQDCEGLLHALRCGVRLIATAHGASLSDFRTRIIYKPLADTGVFTNVLVMNRDKSWRLERTDL